MFMVPMSMENTDNAPKRSYVINQVSVKFLLESEVQMLVVNETNSHQHLDFDSIEDSTLTWLITYDLLGALPVYPKLYCS